MKQGAPGMHARPHAARKRPERPGTAPDMSCCLETLRSIDRGRALIHTPAAAPEPHKMVSLPDERKIKGLITELFHVNAQRAWYDTHCDTLLCFFCQPSDQLQ
jgi:hypothetical protein